MESAEAEQTVGTLGVSPKRCHYDGRPGVKVGRDLLDFTACMHGSLPSTPRRFGLTFACLEFLTLRVQSPDTDLMWAPHITKRAVL